MEGGVVVWLTVLSVCLGLGPVVNGCPLQLSQGKPPVSQDIQGKNEMLPLIFSIISI